MKSLIEQYTGDLYKGNNAARRPDLLLLTALEGRFLLIELKRPNKIINRDDESQAQKYRDELSSKLSPSAS
jgi:hypothetical protein